MNTSNQSAVSVQSRSSQVLVKQPAVPEARVLTRNLSSDSTGSAGLFVSRQGSKRMPMSTQRKIPLPSFGFRKSSVPAHEPPTLLRRTGDESAQFSQADHLKQEQEDPAYSPTNFPESPVASSWFCKHCSYANVDLQKTVCAICGLDSMAKQVPDAPADSLSSPATSTDVNSPNMPHVQDPSSPLQTTIPVALQSSPAITAVNPFDHFSATPTTLNRYETPTGTEPSPNENRHTVHRVSPVQTNLGWQDAGGSSPEAVPIARSTQAIPPAQHSPPEAPCSTPASLGSVSSFNTAATPRTSNLPTPRMSNKTITAAQYDGPLLLSHSNKEGRSTSTWEPRRHSLGAIPNRGHSVALTTANNLHLPDLGESPLVSARRKTAEPQPHDLEKRLCAALPHLSASSHAGRYSPAGSFDESTMGIASSVSSASRRESPNRGVSDLSQGNIATVSPVSNHDTKATRPRRRFSNFWRARRRHSVGTMANDSGRHGASNGKGRGTVTSRGFLRAPQPEQSSMVGERIVI